MKMMKIAEKKRFEEKENWLCKCCAKMVGTDQILLCIELTGVPPARFYSLVSFRCHMTVDEVIYICIYYAKHHIFDKT